MMPIDTCAAIHRRVAAPLLVGLFGALVLGACSTTTGDDATADYPAAMAAICTTTAEQIAALPNPPEQISPENWADEVSRRFVAEAAAAAEIVVVDDTGPIHRSYIATTEDVARAWTALGDQLRSDGTALDDVEALRTEITELSLGRDDLADELGVSACRRSAP